MKTTVHGIHHLTAIAGDARENLDFYANTLGLRLVKKSVNQDAPDTYHLFFADAAGTPGTDITFFPWAEMRPGKLGTGLIIEVPLAVPTGSLGFWQQRFDLLGVSHGSIEERFGEKTLPFSDPHGLPLALVETGDPREFVPWPQSAVPAEHQVRGLHSVRLWLHDVSRTAALLTDHMGFSPVGTEAGWSRFQVDGGGSGTLIELRAAPERGRGHWGTGAVHHVAWRMHDSDEQMALREAIAGAGLQPTEPIDRFWFKSVYFREPGGVLFELATDGPGFDRDEAPEHLGEKLILPPWLEAQRDEIEAALPKLEGK